ncbi:MAG: radical SAM protein [Acidobacteria bacterium]|nr:radical SAM protein [Acidobacteriota bacterium]
MNASQKLVIGGRILASRLTATPRPFFVQYSLLNACNAACAYCNSPNRQDHPLTLAEHRRVLHEFARLGAVRIKFLGGEPLLCPDIEELVEDVRRLGMRSAMVTNGFLIPEKLATVRRLDEVVISLDGDEAAHDRQRGHGTWKRVMRAVELCARERLDFFLSAVVTRQSAGDIDWLLTTARRFGVMVNFQVPQFNEEMYGQNARNWMPPPDEIRSILAKIIAAKKAGAPVLFTARSYERTLNWPDFVLERTERPGQRSPCTAGRYFLQMEPNGDIYPCVLHVGRFQPMNAVRDGVEIAWRHAQHHSCFDCYNTWLNENRAIFALQPEVLANFWRNYLRPKVVEG